MARKKRKGTELSVFKGREAKLNRAIMNALAVRGQQTIYDISKEIRKQRALKHTKYTNVSRRVRILEEQGFTEKAGIRDTQAGAQAVLYQITTRAYVALLLNQISTDLLVKEADEETLAATLSAIALFCGRKNESSDS